MDFTSTVFPVGSIVQLVEQPSGNSKILEFKSHSNHLTLELIFSMYVNHEIHSSYSQTLGKK